MCAFPSDDSDDASLLGILLPHFRITACARAYLELCAEAICTMSVLTARLHNAMSAQDGDVSENAEADQLRTAEQIRDKMEWQQHKLI
eukprot:1280697-Rhodomonas_salina.1